MSTSIPAYTVETIIFACEAGLATSVLGVAALKKKLKQANFSINVIRKPVQIIPSDAKVIFIHKTMVNLARQQAPTALVFSFTQFLDDPVFDQVIQMLRTGELKEL